MLNREVTLDQSFKITHEDVKHHGKKAHTKTVSLFFSLQLAMVWGQTMKKAGTDGAHSPRRRAFHGIALGW